MRKMRVSIVAELTPQQLEYLKTLASQQGIVAEVFIGEEVEQVAPSVTPLTAAMLDDVAVLLEKSILEVAQLANSYGVTTVEETLNHPEIPSNVKELLEIYL